MTVQIIFILASILLTASAQECHKEGQCSGLYVESGDTDSYNLCLEECATNENCNWITYFGENKDCIQFFDCPTIDATCTNCFSGQKECPAYGPVCNAPGVCIGHFISANEASSADKCLRLCQTVDECMWYSFLADESQCILYADCVTFDDTCTDCVSGERECQAEDALENTIFVAGGVDIDKVDYIDLGFVEIVGLSGPSCTGFSICPVSGGTVGVFIDDHPMVCGGTIFSGEYDYDSSSTCVTYNPSTDRWTQSHYMIEERTSASAVQLSPTTWWVTGGFGFAEDDYEAGDPLISTEMFVVGEGFSPSVALPEGKHSHNLVRIDDTHVMLLGGEVKGGEYIPENNTYSEFVFNNKTWLFNTETGAWSNLPDLIVPTAFTQAGLVTLPDGRKEVVVAAGINTNVTQIFSLDTNTWRMGPEFPVTLFKAASIPYGDTFVLVGGSSSEAHDDHFHDYSVNTIYTFNTDMQEWVQLQQTLFLARNAFSAFLIPDDFISCAKWSSE